jgi:hypothetical protein
MSGEQDAQLQARHSVISAATLRTRNRFVTVAGHLSASRKPAAGRQLNSRPD